MTDFRLTSVCCYQKGRQVPAELRRNLPLQKTIKIGTRKKSSGSKTNFIAIAFIIYPLPLNVERQPPLSRLAM